VDKSNGQHRDDDLRATLPQGMLGVVVDEGFSKERIRFIRDLAEKADGFTKRRLLDLVRRYDDPKGRSLNSVPHSLANLPSDLSYRQ
jgi:hypothetical protein